MATLKILKLSAALGKEAGDNSGPHNFDKQPGAPAIILHEIKAAHCAIIVNLWSFNVTAELVN